ncbi:unnamed protein product, partial [Pylaiella littoralis]
QKRTQHTPNSPYSSNSSADSKIKSRVPETITLASKPTPNVHIPVFGVHGTRFVLCGTLGMRVVYGCMAGPL